MEEKVRQAAVALFIDVRGSLKGRLPKKVFKLKCQELYAKWLEAQSEPVPEEAKLQFSNK